MDAYRVEANFSSESPATLRSRLRTEAIERAPITFIHSTPEHLWDIHDTRAMAKILVASLGDEKRSTSVTTKLLQKPHPEVDIRYDRVAGVYQEALNDSADLPKDTKRKLAHAVAALPFEEMPLKSAITVLGTLSEKYGDEVPPISFRYDPSELVDGFEYEDYEGYPEVLGNVVKTSRYYEKVGKDEVMVKIADWANLPKGGRKVIYAGGGATIYAIDQCLPDVLDGLARDPEEQRAFVQRLDDDHVPLGSMPMHIQQRYFAGEPDAERLYQQMSELHPEMISFDEVQMHLARGRYLAKHGRLDEAREVATKVNYNDYCGIFVSRADDNAAESSPRLQLKRVAAYI